jgi:hypothetical protein
MVVEGSMGVSLGYYPATRVVEFYLAYYPATRVVEFYLAY